jgi:2,3-diaminopropionate biosynthesis protein SbnB
MTGFTVVPGTRVDQVLSSTREEVLHAVRRAYLLHHEGDSINPPSQFLRFPEQPAARIISLPAYLGGEYRVAGTKWIASFPGNLDRGLPRASAVLLLNDVDTGVPFACLEASRISAARTAASAVLGAEQLAAGRLLRRVAVVGCGVIARTIMEFVAERRWPLDRLTFHDTTPAAANSLARFSRRHLGLPGRQATNLRTSVAGADVVILATTANSPHLRDTDLLSPGQIVLHISLRDLDPTVVLTAHNVVDDVDHCLTANTSLHLTEQRLGNRDFVSGTLAQLMTGELRLDPDRPLVFSPFGLGVLDLAVGLLVHRAVSADGDLAPVAGFFASPPARPVTYPPLRQVPAGKEPK